MNWYRVDTARWIYGPSPTVPCSGEVLQGPDGFTASLVARHSVGEQLGTFATLDEARAAVQTRATA